MKKRAMEAEDDMLPEYDFSRMKGGVRGKYANRVKAPVRLVVLDGAVADAFPTARDVNDALRSLLRLTRDATVKGGAVRAKGKTSRVAAGGDVVIVKGRGTGSRALSAKKLGTGKAGVGARKRARPSARRPD